MKDLIHDLQKKIEGEILYDQVSKAAYSIDASIFEIEPRIIVIPKSKEELIHAVKTAFQYKIPVTARGAATGITGGCLGSGMIIDTSKYLTSIIEIELNKEIAIVEPGVIQDQLNDTLASFGYRLGPETSTGNRATIGGMVANNSAGSHSLLYGKMVDHVIEIELLLSNGELIRFREMNIEEWEMKMELKGREGEIYRELYRIYQEYKEEIETRYPKIPRRVSGYNLDALLEEGPFNPCKLIVGSEGTFGITTEIKVRICKKPAHIGLCVIHFDRILDGMHAIDQILKHHPNAVELIDDKIISMGLKSPSMRDNLSWLQGKPEALFIVALSAPSKAELHQKLEYLAKENIGEHRIILTQPHEMENVWNLRKSGLGLLLAKRSYSRAISFIEDLTVPPHQLPQFIAKFQQIMEREHKSSGIYGHVGSGCMHLRPYLDLRDPDDRALMKRLMEEMAVVVKKLGGSLSGEHGDGILRSWQLPDLYGEKIYHAFCSLKKAFDPDQLMNPGKIVDGPPVLQNLHQTPEKKVKTFFDFSKEGGFELSVDLCNGNGKCRKPEGLMCPSYQATKDEKDSTRARAQALRAMLNGKFGTKDFASKEVLNILDLCLSCKGCKTECPSQVDMAKMKSEYLYQYQKIHGVPLRSRMITNLELLNQIALPLGKYYNRLICSRLSKWLQNLLGIAPQRTLPLIADELFSDWYEMHTNHEQTRKHVVLFNDTYTEFHRPEIGIAAVKVLNSMGYDVIVPEWHCCGRPLISKGLLEQAKDHAEYLLAKLLPFAKAGLPIIGLEPSCLSVLKDEFRDLLPGLQNQVDTLSSRCVSFDVFVHQHMKRGIVPFTWHQQDEKILFHGHCHQKALQGTRESMEILRSLPGARVEEIKTGCCGMAGSFGYEKEHYEISMAIGDLHLFPAIMSTDTNTQVVADGFSCQTQIKDGTGRKAKHLAEVLAERIPGQH